MNKGFFEDACDGIQRLLSVGPVIYIKWAIREKWTIEYVSPNISRLGYKPEDFHGGIILLEDLIHPEDMEQFSKGVVQLNASIGNSFDGELRLLSIGGDFHRLYHYTILTGEPDDRGTYFCGYFIEMVSHRVSDNDIESRIEYQAYHDLLTNLPNRSLFNDRLKLEIHRAGRNKQKFAVMFLDLDDFKNINDSLGHLTGDMLLREASGRLLKCIRNGDTVARIGGDEFTILLHDIIDIKEIVIAAQRILKVFKEPFFIRNHELYSTVSIGISVFPDDGKNITELLKNSDLAMYHAKEQGKNNYVFFSEEMNEQVRRRLEMENMLWHAMHEEQFVLHYQPILDIENGNIVGMESLVRWNQPGFGLVSPMEFIPMAEETGMIMQLGQWVLEASCRQVNEWKKAGLENVYVSVNVSSRQFIRNDFLDCIHSVLEKSCLDSCLLTLQVTENGIIGIGNRDKVVRIMNSLQKIGIRLSIDDYGMGFSSLNNLKNFPVDTLKIDRSFIQGIPNDHHCVAITRSIIGLAKNLGMTVLAEGVEREDQLDFLVSNRCDLMQGYYFSPPVHSEEIIHMVRSGKNLYK